MMLYIFRALQHPGYREGAPYPNDIALLKLSAPVAFEEHVFPACVPEVGTVYNTSQDECWISGWGDTKSQSMLQCLISNTQTLFRGCI
ncbi:hypothetical protein DPMN_023540 [Dreissena polymorpha]|uniref:Peptidase S1 domain-containing protein n=1 Tax=Dreissena polymorpha TaxID=45954 RepID=A0A9D4LKW9_DREPO|nr:hypothetical protein DPMN_023540 [Dreissena polymorpha]